MGSLWCFPRRSHNAMSMPAMASSVKPWVWDRRRMVENMRSHKTSLDRGSSPMRTGVKRSSTMVLTTRGAAGAWASPMPSIPVSVFTLIRAVDRSEG